MKTKGSGGKAAADRWRERGSAFKRRPLCEFEGCTLNSQPGFRLCGEHIDLVRKEIRTALPVGCKERLKKRLRDWGN